MTSILRRPARPLAAIALLAAGALLALGFSAARSVTASAQSSQDVAHFKLAVNPKFADCLARFPGDARRAPQAELPQHGPGGPLYRVERRRPPGIEDISQPPAIVGADENIAIRPHNPCHFAQRLSGSGHPRKDAQGQHYLERGVRKGEAVHVLHGAVHLLSEASLCRSLARAPDHVIHGIDGVDDETALRQYHGCEPRSAADIEHALAGRER